MIPEDIVGEYLIQGKNQDNSDTVYKGILTLTLDENNRFIAQWTINKTQQQFGTGFFKDNILVLNFNYADEGNIIYKGVAVYRCLTKDILDGFWSEKHGNPLYIGEERCFRIKDISKKE